MEWVFIEISLPNSNVREDQVTKIQAIEHLLIQQHFLISELQIL